jgi:hypothetical protein
MTANWKITGAWCAAFLAACGLALWSSFGVRAREGGGSGRAVAPAAPRVLWRAPVGPRACRPCPAPGGGWFVADGAGGVAKFSGAGRQVWRCAFSNAVFAGAAVVGGRVVVAAEDGLVVALDAGSGAEAWRRATGARFQHAPVTGVRGGEESLWLVSQEDGRLFCLRVADGAVAWVGEETNRCDGEPALCGGLIAYGNCDGAVYLFGAADGKPAGKVEVGEEDQMAGGILAVGDDRLLTGTRSGKLVAVSAGARACVASAKVSESEAFATPVLTEGGEIAMGVDEGWVTFWRCGSAALTKEAEAQVGAGVRSLARAGAGVCAQAGGSLVFLKRGAVAGRVACGDEVGPLASNSAGEVACVADGALVCVSGGGL